MNTIAEIFIPVGLALVVLLVFVGTAFAMFSDWNLGYSEEPDHSRDDLMDRGDRAREAKPKKVRT